MPALTWRLRAWVTNCCNANHAAQAMDGETLAGQIASRAAGERWWAQVRRAPGAPCAALTETGCALETGRPELCNRYFCEGVRDYFWHLGGDRLAGRLDDLQRRWARLYATYDAAQRAARAGRAVDPDSLRRRADIAGFHLLLDTFDAEIAARARPVSASFLASSVFKVEGERDLYEPFFDEEVTAIGGEIRR